ncbi:MAG: hypothetical protein NZ700_00330 [Gemmataceae bacterium]|nr:hypothetical protein [Gemmataceae bacterium]MDW8265860.1 hypothetical protein [Gemmataceae bacterium]
MKKLLTAMVMGAITGISLAQEKEPPVEMAPAPTKEAVARPTRRDVPPAEIVLLPGQASATPYRKGLAFANGGAIEVRQVDPTTVVVTMSGLTATNADLICRSIANYTFELHQDFEVRVNSDKVKAVKLSMEGQVMGLLRSDHSHYTCHICDIGGVAGTQPALAAVAAGEQTLVSLTLPARMTSRRQDLSVYNHEGPFIIPIAPGRFTLHQSWGFGTSHPPFFVRGASAEFSPQPQYFLEPFWFQNIRPFNGIATNDFGFKVTLKVIAD